MDAFIESLPKLPDSREMAAWDKDAIEFGIPEKMLMENAGRAIFEAASEEFRLLGPVCIFMGGGNNGGDAACLARHFRDARIDAAIYCLKNPENLGDSSGWHLELAIKNGAKFYRLNPAEIKAPATFLGRFIADNGALPTLLVDGLIGAGLERELKPETLDFIQMINALADLLQKPILAIDIPSGLNSRSGRPSPDAIRAALTVTLAAVKPGMLLPEATPFVGKIACRKIGFPAAFEDSFPAAYRLLEGRSLAFAPAPVANGFKNEYGRIVVFGGALGYAGAAHLACAGALRAGAGLVSACAPAANLARIKLDWPEIMTEPASDDDKWPATLPQNIIDLAQKASALVIGPGMGRGEDAADFLAALLQTRNRPPAVIDADALFLLSQNPLSLTSLDIITPHPGEAGFLLESSGAEVQKDRRRAMEKLCAKTGAVVVLKGAATLLGQGDGVRLLSPYDIPALAIGGAGDVLSGCIGGLLGSRQYENLSSLGIAGFGVALHAMAALRLAKIYSHRGFVASQLADSLPFAREFALGNMPALKGLTPWPR